MINRALPAGLEFAGGVHNASDVTFLSDRTWIASKGVRHSEQQIFDFVFDAIRRARKLVLLDMFYYNDFQRGKPETTRLLSSELTDALVQHKKGYPDIQIVLITDPINTVYGSTRSAQFSQLTDAGIDVVVTDLTRLRDSNPLYSIFWRFLFRPLGNSEGGWLPNPLDSKGRATIRSYLALLNYKANHRKTLVADEGDDLIGIISSANPQDASSGNDNVAIRFGGPAVKDLLASENAVLKLSGAEPVELPLSAYEQNAGVSVQVLTEKAIKTGVLRMIDGAQPGDCIDLAMFFLSDRDVIGALIEARRKGTTIRVLLDPNKDSFGHRKYGIPNRPVAAELLEADIEIRWGDTHGEQFHTKMVLVDTRDSGSYLLLGSANMTRRNLDNLNLETSALVRAPASEKVMKDARGYFDLLWNNTDEQNFSVSYERYGSDSAVMRYLYRFMEWSGWSTF